ncbi:MULTISPECIES: DUF2971 domain-containing protein [Acinetobacter]|uniref:DUF2971 domain-containing protein n=1 Tax=Acinetobacter TaxID=469 RepID=UPI00143FF8F2|nr:MULTISPECIES: DUF2971 domain-containing protein [Acinetobacter]MCP0915868.1 DUF2971 domain-containing protein [Acinetobacter indicus]MCP0918995.1 DUF2971 domain-containing protein [Acinetobacter indicus]MCP0921661.1 DUF2971 domain-containing protein [Acinetobacter indicus]MDM1277287.1 DUF2971 domain-containing protein [Acinetobacter indicus]MDM1289900.1 DUF2971 domain-containing protein [Acinetobacter indicus]
MLNISEYPFVYQDEDYIYLYKHQPITDSRLELLTKGTISFTKPDKFNDPFDCVYAVDESYHYSVEEIQKKFLELFKQKISNEEAMHYEKESIEKENQAINDLTYFADINSLMGICCLNHNPLNILMWSHYADFHKGFLTEFKFRKTDLLNPSLNYLNFFPIPVSYMDEMLVIDRETRLDPNGKIIEIYTSKAAEWSYEKEFRVIRPNTSESIQKLPYDDLICSVIGGLKISVADEKKLEMICEAENIPYYRVQRISNTYKLTVPNHHQLDVEKKN